MLIHEDEMTEDQKRLIRRFKKNGSRDGRAGGQATGRGAGK
jgi:hypothetical protein